MFVRFTNIALLGLLVVLTLTGLWGLAFTLHGWLFDVHRAAGWAVLALAPWKALISWRSLRRGFGPRLDRNLVVVVSLLLAALTLIVLAFGLMWAWRTGPELVAVGGYADTLISWHWMLALGLLAPLAVHVWRRWPKPRRADFTSRRAALKLLGLGAAGVAGWWAAGRLSDWRASPSALRRFTGSVEQASFTGNGCPVTNSAGEGQTMLDPATWGLVLRGAVERPLRLAYGDLLALPSVEQVATLDCTTGWYSTQAWRGVRLAALLDLAGLRDARLIRLRGASGYTNDFTLAEAREVLLATHVGGKPLRHWHGFPLRAVAPTRRGWCWTKWLVEIEAVSLG